MLRAGAPIVLDLPDDADKFLMQQLHWREASTSSCGRDGASFQASTTNYRGATVYSIIGHALDVESIRPRSVRWCDS